MRRSTSRAVAWIFHIFLVFGFSVPAEAGPLPRQAYVQGVKGHAQGYTLSCEARSAVDWAAFWGVSIREKKFLANLPRSDNPDAGFVGDPNDPWGFVPPRSYGVHAEPVAALLRAYGLSAQARRGLNWDDLRAEIAAGRPAIVWVIGQMWRGVPLPYTAVDGRTTVVAAYEHSVILVGYSPTTVTIVDAYSGQNQVYFLEDFLASWSTLGKLAVTGGVAAASPAPTPAPPGLPAANIRSRAYLPLVFTRSGQAAGDARLSRQPGGPEAAGFYRVKPGDYLTALAKRFGMDWRTLAQVNGLQPPYVIYPGQELRLW